MLRGNVQVIGRRYKVESEIGSGGMGEVYRVLDRLNNRTVALKHVRLPEKDNSGDSASPEELRLALAQEFQTLASLRHPYIISVLDYGFDDDGQPYLTMELLDDPLNIVQASYHRPFDVQLTLLMQMLEAINYLHWRGIIHRDLKPDNVLVMNDHVKVLDFGLAISQKTDDIEQTIAGTLLYLAPELLTGQTPAVTSDLYAVGVIAYQMFTNRHPYPESVDASGLITSILYDLPALSLLDDIPEMQSIIARLLSKDPVERYQSTTDVINAINAATNRPSPDRTAIRESFLQAADFVGRDDELRQFESALEMMRNGTGNVWLVGGESGVGKSRLLNEVRIRALINNVHVLRGQGISEGGLPYQMWRDALRALLLTTEISDEEASRLKLLLPAIDAIIGRDVADIIVDEGARQRDQQLLIDTILKIFERQTNPTLLLLEDLQWTQESLDVLRGLLPLTQQRPLLIIGTYRNDERPSLPDELPDARLLLLNRLSREQIIDLSQSMLNQRELQPELVDLLHRETEGNILFLVEVLRSLAGETGNLSEIGLQTLPVNVIAGGVQKIIQARIDRVPVTAQRLLQIAALYGRQLDLAIMKQIVPDEDIDAWVLMCADAAILEADEDHWRFAHDKLRETLISMVADIADYHRLLGEAIESIYPDNPELANRLVYHWSEAGDDERERRYSIQAGQLSLKTFAFKEAIRYFERAAALQDSDEQSMEVALVQNNLGHAYQSISLYEQASEFYNRSIDIYRQSGDEQRLMLALADTGFVMGYGMGKQVEARAIFDEARQLADRLDDIHVRGRVYRGLASISFTTGDYQDALVQTRIYKSICEECNDMTELARSWNLLGVLNEFTGDYQAAVHAYRETEKLFEFVTDPGLQTRVMRGIGEVLFRLERVDDAEPYLEKGAQIARSIDEGHSLSLTLSSLASIAAFREDYDRARQLGAEGIQVGQKIGHPLVLVNALNRMGDVEIQAGEIAAGLNYLRRALVIAHEKGTVALASHSFSSIAQAAVMQQDTAHALELLGVVFNDTRRDARATQRATALLDELQATIDAATIDAGLEQGQQLPLQTYIAHYLEIDSPE